MEIKVFTIFYYLISAYFNKKTSVLNFLLVKGGYLEDNGQIFKANLFKTGFL